MSPVDPTTLLRELRPPADARPDAAALERLLLAGPEPAPRRRSSYVRPAVVAGALAVAATAVVVVSPGGPAGTPTVLGRAAAAVSRPNTILHFRATVANGSRSRALESWQTTDGRRERTVFDDGALESVRDRDARTFTTYDRERDDLLVHRDPDWFRERLGSVGLARGNDLLAVTTVGDLRALLQRAEDGDGVATVVGRSTIRGIPVEQVRITSSVTVLDPPPGADLSRPRGLPTKQLTTVRDIFLNRDDALPVRLVDHGTGDAPDRTVDYLEVQQLPRTADNDALLRMSEHPGATRTDEGRFE